MNVKKSFKNFAPRTGMSWRLNDQSVVRAGYGASTIPFPDNRYAFNFPVKQNYSGSVAEQLPARRHRWRPASRPRSCANIPGTGIIPVAGIAAQLDVRRHPAGLHEGTLHSWNVAFQRQLPFRFAADIAYVGNRGVDLVMDVDPNASMVYNSGNAGRPQFAQFNRTGVSRTRTNPGKSQYHGLQMKLDRRFRNGLMITNSYTLSRSMDYANENGGIGTPIDFDLSWARSNFDRMHNYVPRPIYDLPFGPGKTLDDRRAGRQDHRRLADQHAVRRAVGHAADHWRQRHAAEHAGQHRLREPDRRTTGPRRPRARACCYFDPTVYSLPAASAQGNMRRNSGPEGPGFWQLDGALFKRFTISGSRYAEFRVDAFNVTNSVRWGNPDTGFSIATGNTFGQITGTTGSQRTLRFGGRFVF